MRSDHSLQQIMNNLLLKEMQIYLKAINKNRLKKFNCHKLIKLIFEIRKFYFILSILRPS